MKGQITVNNLVMLFITLLLYLLCFVPVITPIINSTVLYLNTSPNSMTPLITTLLYLVPFFFLLAIVMTAFNWATPSSYNNSKYQ